jgi:hypothetical protein
MQGHNSVALLSGALTAILFLLVLVIVAGWNDQPLAGAAILTVLPAAALAAMRIPGDPRTRAIAGSLLIAGGVAALAAMVTDSAWWTIAPELAAGVGMGLALPAISQSLLPERTPADAARVLTARHAGITIALLLLAPVIAARLDTAIDHARQQEVAVLVDSPLNPVSKVQLAGKLVEDVTTSDARRDLDRAFVALRPTLYGNQRADLDELQHRSDQTLTSAVDDTFRPAFMIAAVLAFAAALVLLPARRPRVVIAATIVAIAVSTATTAMAFAVRPTPITIAHPCQPRLPRASQGIAGTIQNITLRGLDATACQLNISREQLVRALTDQGDAWTSHTTPRLDLRPSLP